MSGTIGMPSQTIEKGKKRTWYRLHPNQDDPSFFGQVMVMPNLPDGAFIEKAGEKMSIREMYESKGFKQTPQELRPDAKVEYDDKGNIYLVPEGYELKEVADKSLLADNKTYIDVTIHKVVRKTMWDKPMDLPESDELKCDECGTVCKNKVGLIAHKRKHTKNNSA